MRFEQLRCLIEIAKTGTITGAAQNLFMTQQAVSVSIRQLEEEIGLPLMVRTKTGVQLTEAGAEASRFAYHLLKEKDDFLSNMRSSQKEVPEQKLIQLKVASNSPVMNVVLPSVFVQMDMKVNKDLLHVSASLPADRIIEHVKQGTRDFGLITMQESRLLKKMEAEQDILQMDVLARDEIVCVKGRNFYKWEQNYISPAEFHARPISLYNLEPINDGETEENYITCSNDVHFQRKLMDSSGVITLMPGLAYQYFFAEKKFASMLMEEVNRPLLHAAVYRKNASPQLLDVIAMIRNELHKK
ncbi:MAG: LysR family transcriptional regulator [Peptococcaceae bacterium]|nr:LysR family transcriptional regulator [Peptococcaceae bacterium]